MRVPAIAFLLLAATQLPAADECTTGPKTTVDEVIIDFTCPPPPSTQVRWFNRSGAFRNIFAWPSPTRPINRPFSPRVILMATDFGGGCVAGEYLAQPDGRCVAHYTFPCPERHYRLRIVPDPAVDYDIQRAIPVNQRRDVLCRFSGDGTIAAHENVTVRLYGRVDKSLPLLSLPPIDLTSAPPAGLSKSYGADALAGLISKNVQGQGGGGPSDNAETIAARQKRNAPKSVKVTIEALP